MICVGSWCWPGRDTSVTTPMEVKAMRQKRNEARVEGSGAGAQTAWTRPGRWDGTREKHLLIKMSISLQTCVESLLQ